jgi:hypothetical protein
MLCALTRKLRLHCRPIRAEQRDGQTVSRQIGQRKTAQGVALNGEPDTDISKPPIKSSEANVAPLQEHKDGVILSLGARIGCET